MLSTCQLLAAACSAPGPGPLDSKVDQTSGGLAMKIGAVTPTPAPHARTSVAGSSRPRPPSVTAALRHHRDRSWTGAADRRSTPVRTVETPEDTDEILRFFRSCGVYRKSGRRSSSRTDVHHTGRQDLDSSQKKQTPTSAFHRCGGLGRVAPEGRYAACGTVCDEAAAGVTCTPWSDRVGWRQCVSKNLSHRMSISIF